MKNIFFPWKRIAELEAELATERYKAANLQRELDLQKVNRAKSTIIISNRKGQLFEGNKP